MFYFNIIYKVRYFIIKIYINALRGTAIYRTAKDEYKTFLYKYLCFFDSVKLFIVNYQRNLDFIFSLFQTVKYYVQKQRGIEFYRDYFF